MKGYKKCKECGTKFKKERPLQFVCSPTCAVSYNKKHLKKQELKEWKKHKKNQEEKLKIRADWKEDLQKVVNWIVRNLDKDQPCISHPNTKGFLRYDAGHFYSVGSHQDIRYNMHNIHKQNSEANQRHGGNADYAKGLKERYGNDYLEMVLNLPLQWKGTAKEKFTIDNIKNEYLPAARKVKRGLEKGEEYTRDEINKIIGIYNDNLADQLIKQANK